MYTCTTHVQIPEIIVLYQNFAFLSPFSQVVFWAFFQAAVETALEVNLVCLVDLYFRKEDYEYDDHVSLVTSYVKKAVCPSIQETNLVKRNELAARLEI